MAWNVFVRRALVVGMAAALAACGGGGGGSGDPNASGSLRLATGYPIKTTTLAPLGAGATQTTPFTFP